MKLVVVDAGGTHARFAIADVEAGRPPQLGPSHRYRTREHAGLADTWRHFARDVGEELPGAASIAVAAPIGEAVLRFVNSTWTIDTRTLKQDLGISRFALLNDFGAVAHAMAVLGEEDLIALHGPDGPIPAEGTTTVIGPGTGLGVAILLHRNGRFDVVETESAHIAFAPLDAEQAAVGEQLRQKFGRVSVERLVSGPGLTNIVAALAAIEGVPDPALPDAELWTRALAGNDPLAVRALDHFLAAFGAAAGDFALAHGSMSVVITGGLANRLGDRLRTQAFAEAFRAKGRYRERMEKIRIRLATYPEPGLFGAAVAFQRQHLS